MRQANVYNKDRLAGSLVETEDGYKFTYETDYLVGGTPIGFNFPLQTMPFKSKTFPCLFENLVSEGWLRKLQSQEQKIDENDRFGLLLANGLDLVGAITIGPINK